MSRAPYRGPQGERSGNSVLTPQDVREIRRKDPETGCYSRTVLELCKLLLVSGETIRKIRRGEAWAWLVDGLEEQEPSSPGSAIAPSEIDESLDRLKGKLS